MPRVGPSRQRKMSSGIMSERNQTEHDVREGKAVSYTPRTMNEVMVALVLRRDAGVELNTAGPTLIAYSLS